MTAHAYAAYRQKNKQSALDEIYFFSYDEVYVRVGAGGGLGADGAAGAVGLGNNAHYAAAPQRGRDGPQMKSLTTVYQEVELQVRDFERSVAATVVGKNSK